MSSPEIVVGSRVRLVSAFGEVLRPFEHLEGEVVAVHSHSTYFGDGVLEVETTEGTDFWSLEDVLVAS